jgi:hypothetical protein
MRCARVVRKHLLVFLGIALVASCSDGSDPAGPPGDGGGNGGATVTAADTLRVQMVSEVAEQLDQWAGLDPDTIAARALAYLQDEPSIRDAGITPGTTTVWAVFNDGVSLILPNNRATGSMADTLVDDASASESAMRASSAPRRIPAGRRAVGALAAPEIGLELPASNTFRAVNPIGTCHVDPLPVLKSLLTGGGYVDARPGPATVEGLKRVRGDGVFYINTHGGIGFDGQQTPIYSLWTADAFDITTVTPERKQMLLDSELSVMVEKTNDPLGGCKNIGHYGITAHFVNRYMSFAKNSLVIIDACESGSAQAIDMRQAFANRNASVYVGWTKRVDANFAYKSMKYLIDRLLGANRITPETPKQRAFNIDDIRADMAQNRNLVNDPYQNAILTVFRLKDDFGLLAPSIQFLSVEEREDESRLIIAGMFGTDPGDGKRAVRINGQSLDVITWQSHLIECDVPVSGANAAGTVVVEVGEGSNLRKSNAVNLTEWKGDVIYTRDDPGDQNVAMTLRVHFRADIHAFRDMPHEQPWETTVLFGPMRDASASITAAGSYVKIDGQCTDTYPFSGSWNQPSPYQTAPEGGWNYLGSVDTQNHELLLHTFALFLVPAARWIRGGAEECGSYDIQLHIGAQIDECLFDDLQGVTAFRIAMEQDFSVPADTRGPWTVPALVAPLAELSGEASVRWNNFTVNHPPDPDAAR